MPGTNRTAKELLDKYIAGETFYCFLLTANTTGWQDPAVERDMALMSAINADEPADASYARVALSGLVTSQDDVNDRGELTIGEITFTALTADSFAGCSIAASGTALTAATAVFAAGDVGKQITVPGAGAAGADLLTTISAYVSGTEVTVADAAGTTVSGVAVPVAIIGVGFERRVTDDTDSVLKGAIDVSAVGTIAERTPDGGDFLVRRGSEGLVHVRTAA